MKNKRISKDEYYLGIAKEVARRSTCFRRFIGAIIIRDDQIISTGYVGAPRKTKDSFEHGFCLRDKLKIPHGQRYELCRSVHAEQNAIINAARAGVSLLGGDIYIYGSVSGKDEPIDAIPCYICKKMIINAGLNRVICSSKDGKMKIFRVAEWIKDWQQGDILDDSQQYG
jgi:dCMP deaminase